MRAPGSIVPRLATADYETPDDRGVAASSLGNPNEGDIQRLAATLNADGLRADGLRCKRTAHYHEGRLLYRRALSLLERTAGGSGPSVRVIRTWR
jgi:hypothetical protein